MTIHHCEIGENMPSMYATTSNVLYGENICYEVAAAVSDCPVIINIIIIIITSHRVVVEPPLNSNL